MAATIRCATARPLVRTNAPEVGCPKFRLAAVSSSFARGKALRIATPASTTSRLAALQIQSAATGERLRLHNLSPCEGSKQKRLRKGRGHAAGQGQTCGFGNRGQKSRAGRPTRPGFEGGQTPLYRRLPKLRGIASGRQVKTKQRFVTVNLADLNGKFSAGEEVSKETLIAKRIINPSGKQRKLPLKVLGDGELAAGVSVKAKSISRTAISKVEAAGGSIELIRDKQNRPGFRPKRKHFGWTKDPVLKAWIKKGGKEPLGEYIRPDDHYAAKNA